MKKEDVMVVAQLLTSMKDSIGKMEESQRNGDSEGVREAKEEILVFQKKIGEMI